MKRYRVIRLQRFGFFSKAGPPPRWARPSPCAKKLRGTTESAGLVAIKTHSIDEKVVSTAPRVFHAVISPTLRKASQGRGEAVHPKLRDRQCRNGNLGEATDQPVGDAAEVDIGELIRRVVGAVIVGVAARLTPSTNPGWQRAQAGNRRSRGSSTPHAVLAGGSGSWR